MELEKITAEDFILKAYEWTKISRYAVDSDGMLIRYDGEKVGFPIYLCLYEGWWEVSDACGVSYGSLADAEPVSRERAREIIIKEAKPSCKRPLERNNWLNC